MYRKRIPKRKRNGLHLAYVFSSAHSQPSLLIGKMDFEIETAANSNDNVGFILILFQFYDNQTVVITFSLSFSRSFDFLLHVIPFHLTKYFVILLVNRHAVQWIFRSVRLVSCIVILPVIFLSHRIFTMAFSCNISYTHEFNPLFSA